MISSTDTLFDVSDPSFDAANNTNTVTPRFQNREPSPRVVRRNYGAYSDASKIESASVEARSSNATPDVITANFAVFNSLKLRPSTINKLMTLAALGNGWRGPGSSSLSSTALANFLTFWAKVRIHAVEPDIALTSSGELQVQWYKSKNYWLELCFRPDNRVVFGLFKRDNVHEGMDSLQNVIRILVEDPEKPLQWRS